MIKRLKINCRRYVFHNYGDGWDVYYYNSSIGELEVVEYGCASWEDALNIATKHSKEEL